VSTAKACDFLERALSFLDKRALAASSPFEQSVAAH